MEALCVELQQGSRLEVQPEAVSSLSAATLLQISLAALDTFLQANVTGPVYPPDFEKAIGTAFFGAWKKAESQHKQDIVPTNPKKACLKYLGVDGIVPYAYTPHLGSCCLAKYTLSLISAQENDIIELSSGGRHGKQSLAWSRLRFNMWHYKIITQPTLGANFTKTSQWSEVPTLVDQIINDIETTKGKIIGDEVWAEESSNSWSKEDKVLFLIEAANNYILLGRYEKAKDMLQEATIVSGLRYALSGALGKRTKFQENDISQLVVLAKSADAGAVPDNKTAHDDEDEAEAKPDALKLNHDTLLEEIQFKKEKVGTGDEAKELPKELAELIPDEQPQLSPLDQMIILTEATLKDAFSPADTLTAEEILPYAVRVISDKSTNWQIYTQALLVRSRIELHRSRTMERGVLQLQVVADQILTDVAAPLAEKPKTEDSAASEAEVPAISLTTPEDTSMSLPIQPKPTTFLPAAKPSESAPAHARLLYIHALSTPPKWHIESELAHAWANVGSLASALEIFKRLHLWAEVALCLATAASIEDEDGRGSGGDTKAKGIIRWRLFHKTGDPASDNSDPDDEKVGDISSLKGDMFTGPERTPPPANAPRLWCILGELENDPAHFVRAWEVSSHRYARAQKSLGEYYLQQKNLSKAREAYKLATEVNRLSPELWSRLGDISLNLGDFDAAAKAYNKCIASANDTEGGGDGRTWSNLGSALWSLYLERTAKDAKQPPPPGIKDKALEDEEEEDTSDPASTSTEPTPSQILSQSLQAYKKGATIAHSNWRIWDNVLTISTRLSPPAITDTLVALMHIIRIRKTETCLDTDILSALLNDVVLSKEKTTPSAAGIYDPPRGSHERHVMRLFEEEIVPLITYRAELWALVSKLRGWRRDFTGAVDASERAWRATFGSSSSGLLTSEGENGSEGKDWATDKDAWTEMVRRTEELISVLENWGPQTEMAGRWKGKAKSAVRSVMGKGKEMWEGNDGWVVLDGLMEQLKAAR